MTGSYNWTYAAANHNYEICLILSEVPELSKKVLGRFNQSWANETSLGSKIYTKKRTDQTLTTFLDSIKKGAYKPSASQTTAPASKENKKRISQKSGENPRKQADLNL
jgi:phosphatidylserine/phosphatidylglycerophosphate/cardiolipin synthase-like enzyme